VRAFEARRRLGDKVGLALLIANMAELKLEVGMIVEAEQILAFGRQACGPGMPASRASHFAVTAALIHFARGRTIEARAELKSAFATITGSLHGGRLAECWRLAARIALDEGDLAAARTAIEHAAASAESGRARAWVALLEATLARALGEPLSERAEEALERARDTGDPDLCRDAHVLLCHAASLEGDAHSARMHLNAASALRDEIADALPEDVRSRFLARRELTELAKLLDGEPGMGSPNPSGGHDGEPGRGSPNPSGLDRRVLTQTAPERRGAADGDGEAVNAGGLEAGISIRPAAAEALPRAGNAVQTGDPVVAPALRRMVGRTPAMVALGRAVLKVGTTDATVLVHGESGTGKELVAEAIHEASPRRAGPIVKVNCAALVETLLLSELFGHEKGAFTGAAARRRGRFEIADGGTLFLDEIGDISPRTQVALLRVLQDKTFERVGGATPNRVNLRVLVATHRDLAGMVARGEFREDLYYRLRGVVLEVPALRQLVSGSPTCRSWRTPFSSASLPTAEHRRSAFRLLPSKRSVATPGPAISASSRTRSAPPRSSPNRRSSSSRISPRTCTVLPRSLRPSPSIPPLQGPSQALNLLRARAGPRTAWMMPPRIGPWRSRQRVHYPTQATVARRPRSPTPRSAQA
jgi:hypothetical protein